MTDRTPIALTIAGSDPSGGAGIQADLKTFAAFKVYGAAVLTALTAQNTRGVDGVMGVPPDFIAQQIASVASDLKVSAVKTGMLGDTATVEAVARAIERHGLHPLVVDPVMVATSGDVLLSPDAIAAVRTILLPLADLLTPNLHEAAKLTGQEIAVTPDQMASQGAQLLALGAKAVLVKGGHGSGDAVDVLVTPHGTRAYTSPRIDTRNTHGTGCTLSAAVAAGLARGHDVETAVGDAKAYVWQGLLAGKSLTVGSGNGPLDHNARPEQGEWGH
ncbi:MAG: bifunctional hydroxymethylpyrimidine kinase/phosphomethylpyrimidine kinase [Hyphomicrobiaceae bacterium]|nr:bifunctional hydroxymethylpyrimidine kinase/phosphomethylpyrimidine kinase [Hyphomicrobiaceae bacterium]